MDFLNKSFAQISELFRGLSVGARIASLLLLTTVVVSLVYLIAFHSANPDEFVLNARPVTPDELKKIENAFSQAGLTNWKVEGSRVGVPRGRKHEYIAAMADGDALPRDFFTYIDQALDKSSFWRSDRHRADDIKFARQKDLSLVLRRMDGIDNATVQYDSMVTGGFKKHTEVTAAVTIWPTPGVEFDPQRVESVRKLVANSIAGLQSDKVTVIDMETGQIRFDGSGDMAGASRNVYQLAKQEFERHYGRTLRDALAYVDGARVNLNVELDPNLRLDSKTHRLDKTGSVPIQMSERMTEQTSSTSEPGGRPGVAKQGGISNTQQEVSRTEKQTEVRTIEESSESTTKPSETVITKSEVGLRPNRVSVAVSVPTSYYDKVWAAQNPPEEGDQLKAPTPNEMDRLISEVDTVIRNTVAGLLPPKPAGDDSWDPVTVTKFQSLPTEPPPGISTVVLVMDWLNDNWATLGMILVGAFSLIMLRSMVKSMPTPALSTPLNPASAPSTASSNLSVGVPDESAEEQDLEDELRLLKRKPMSGPNLREELADMVRENPDAAASVISSWIGSAK